MEFKHQSVLLSECMESLNIRPDGIYVDGTLGGGGHSYEICRRLSDKGRLIGIDQDEAAIEAARARLGEFKDKVTIIRSNYCNMKAELTKLHITAVDGILLDLGVSSYQLDNAERGFTYREDAPLDMRMDQRQEMTARDIVNGYSESDLYRIIRDYGEDKFAKNIAKHIVSARSENHWKHWGVNSSDKSGDSDESPCRRRTPGQKNLSGDSDRTEQGTGCAERFPWRYDRSSG